MVTLTVNVYRRKTLGLTLIEVLIALAIVSIAMTAIIKAVSQNIRSTAYLQDKTIAMYVAQQVINEARVGLFASSPDENESYKQTEMLGHVWYWQARIVKTAESRINKISVSVFSHQPLENEVPIITLNGYVYHE